MINKNFHKTSFILMILLVAIMTLNFSAPVLNSNWELVYENDSNGRKISENLEKLIDEVMDGKDVKGMLHFYSAEPHYQMQLSKVKVDICNRIVSGYKFDFRQNPSESNVYSRISSYSTNGEYISTYEENKYYRNPEVIRVSMSWYVKNSFNFFRN